MWLVSCLFMLNMVSGFLKMVPSFSSILICRLSLGSCTDDGTQHSTRHVSQNFQLSGDCWSACCYHLLTIQQQIDTSQLLHSPPLLAAACIGPASIPCGPPPLFCPACLLSHGTRPQYRDLQHSQSHKHPKSIPVQVLANAIHVDA